MLQVMNDRYLLILLAVLLVASIGVFFLYVPILPTIGAVVVLIGVVAMFSLGYHIGQNTPSQTGRYRTPQGPQNPDLPYTHTSVSDVRDRFRDVA